MVHLDIETITERIFDKNNQINDLDNSIEALKTVRFELQKELKELNAWRETLSDQ